jgi:hypothetical protein
MALRTVLLFVVGLAAASAADRPNIVFILVDDLGPEWISAYGAEEIETPNIDKLASPRHEVRQRLLDAAVHAHPCHAADRAVPFSPRLDEPLGRASLGRRLPLRSPSTISPSPA